MTTDAQLQRRFRSPAAGRLRSKILLRRWMYCANADVPLRGIRSVKRFTETEKWRDPWFLSLPLGSKVLFLYLVDRCDNAGFCEENPRLACFETGLSESEYDESLKGLARGIKGASGWLWIRRFLRHQKNEGLKESNPAHRQIIRLIEEQVERFEEVPEFRGFIAPYLPLFMGLKRPIGKGIGKGNGTGKGESEGESERIYQAYPHKVGKPDALRAISRALSKTPFDDLLQKTKAFASARNGDTSFCPNPATWFNQERYNDDPATWTPKANGQHPKPKEGKDPYEPMSDKLWQLKHGNS